jgi:hypothetical protein
MGDINRDAPERALLTRFEETPGQRTQKMIAAPPALWRRQPLLPDLSAASSTLLAVPARRRTANVLKDDEAIVAAALPASLDAA